MIYRVIMDGNDILNFQERPFVLLTPTLNLELNTAGSFEFTMPPSHYFYDSVHPLLSTIEVYEDDVLLWFGRPMEIKVDFWKQCRVYCEGALSFFNDSIQRPYEYDGISLHTFFRTVISAHNAQVAADRQFTVGSITVPDKSVYRKLNYNSTFEVLKKQCIGAEGGYLFVRREDGTNYIDWLEEMPYTCNQPVEFGLNLLDMTSDFDGSAIATCVLPLGDSDAETGEALTVASVNGGSDVIESEAVSTYGRITKAVNFSGVKEPSTLYSDGLEYLQNSQFDNLVIECSAAELHSQNENYQQFRVGQMVHCRSVPHLVDRTFPLMKLSLQLDTAAKQITLGTAARQSLTRIYKDVQETAQEEDPATQEQIDHLEELIEDLSEQISNIQETTQEQIDDLGGEIENLGNQIGDFHDTTQEQFENYEELIEDLGGQIGSVQDMTQEQIDNMGGLIGDLGNQIEDIRNAIDGSSGGGDDGWTHQIDGTTTNSGTINFVTVT